MTERVEALHGGLEQALAVALATRSSGAGAAELEQAAEQLDGLRAAQALTHGRIDLLDRRRGIGGELVDGLGVERPGALADAAVTALEHVLGRDVVLEALEPLAVVEALPALLGVERQAAHQEIGEARLAVGHPPPVEQAVRQELLDHGEVARGLAGGEHEEQLRRGRTLRRSLLVRQRPEQAGDRPLALEHTDGVAEAVAGVGRVEGRRRLGVGPVARGGVGALGRGILRRRRWRRGQRGEQVDGREGGALVRIGELGGDLGDDLLDATVGAERRLVGGVGEKGAPQLVERGEVAAGRRRALDEGDEELAAVAAHQLELHARQQAVEHAPRRPLGDVVESTGVEALDVGRLDGAQLRRRQGRERGHRGRWVGAVVAGLQSRRQVGLARRRQAVDEGAGDEERERVEDLQAVPHVPAVDPQPVQVADDALALLGEAPLHDAPDRGLAQADADVFGLLLAEPARHGEDRRGLGGGRLGHGADVTALGGESTGTELGQRLPHLTS